MRLRYYLRSRGVTHVFSHVFSDVDLLSQFLLGEHELAPEHLLHATFNDLPSLSTLIAVATCTNSIFNAKYTKTLVRYFIT